jgi:hypothetical protein
MLKMINQNAGLYKLEVVYIKEDYPYVLRNEWSGNKISHNNTGIEYDLYYQIELSNKNIRPFKLEFFYE